MTYRTIRGIHALHDIDVQVAEHVLARLIILEGAVVALHGVLEFQGLLDFFPCIGQSLASRPLPQRHAQVRNLHLVLGHVLGATETADALLHLFLAQNVLGQHVDECKRRLHDVSQGHVEFSGGLPVAIHVEGLDGQGNRLEKYRTVDNAHDLTIS